MADLKRSRPSAKPIKRHYRQNKRLFADIDSVQGPLNLPTEKDFSDQGVPRLSGRLSQGWESKA